MPPKRSASSPLNTQKIIVGVLILLLVAALAVVAIGYVTQRSKSPIAAVPTAPTAPTGVAPTLTELFPALAYQKYKAGAFFLDVRQPEEYAAGYIPNSTLIPLDELESRLDELPRDKEIVVVCRSGGPSQEGRDILLKNGFTSVYSMDGGVIAWAYAGFPFIGEVPVPTATPVP